MFESLVISFLKSYLGDYIDNLENITLGIMSGELDLKDLEIKPKKLNEMKLPFKLVHGRIGSLKLSIPWKGNFSSPTILNMEEIHLVLSLIPQEKWEFIDFISGNIKLENLKKFAADKILELSDALTTQEKSLGYLDRTLIKIMDNIHINIKNVHFRIEEPNKAPFYSMGFTLQEMMVINTDENWNEIFIDRNKYKDINVYKLLKIQNFGFYLKVNETNLFSIINDSKALKKVIKESFQKTDKYGKDFEYLIKPISLTSKLKQNNKNLIITQSQENSSSENSQTNDLIEGFSKINIYINLEKFDIDFQKSQFDTIIRIMNDTSNYQKFQYFHYESRKVLYFKPNQEIKRKPRLWWRYAITCVIKRLRYLRGNEKEYDRADIVMNKYEEKFYELHKKYLKDPLSLSNDEFQQFLFILSNVEQNLLYQWSIKGIKESFTLQKREENKKNKTSLMGKIFGKKINEENLLSPEEMQKIEEVIESSKKQLKNELILTSKEVKLKVEFLLSEGSFVFSRTKNDTKESFSFKYKDLSFHLKKGENFTEIDAYLKNFVIDMITVYNKNKIKTSQITFYDKEVISREGKKLAGEDQQQLIDIKQDQEDYIWKLNFIVYGPGEKINSKMNLHINNVNIIYDQSFLERILSFFIIETSINEDIVNIAWDKWSEIKEKTSETIKSAFERKNLLEINIEPRKMVIPLNKYDSKRSKILVVDFGKVIMKNTDPIDNYDERYKLDFINTNIKHYSSLNQIYFNDKSNYFELVNDLSMKLTFGMLSKICPTHIKEQLPSFKIDLNIENINLKISESLYYTMHFIIDVMKPTKNMDHWSIVEQSKREIKNNCSVLGKILKKNKLNKSQEYFAVLAGGYIYFFKHIDDDNFESYFYIKDALISEKVISSSQAKTDIKDSNSNTANNAAEEYTILLKNKYGLLELTLPNENKFKQWLKGIKERINEMKLFHETNIPKPEIDTTDLETVGLGLISKENFDKSAAPVTKAENKNNQNKGSLQAETEAKKGEERKTSVLESNACLNPLKVISFEIAITIDNVNIEFVDENKENQILFIMKFNEFSFDFKLRELDIDISIELGSMQLYDQKFFNDNSFYEMITSINKLGNKTKIFSMNLLIVDEGSPFKIKNTSMDFDLRIGCIYAVWQPHSIKRLLFFLAHNEILRNKIKDEIMIPRFEETISLVEYEEPKDQGVGNKESINGQETNKKKDEKAKDFEAADSSDEDFKLLKCNESKDLYLSLKLSLQEVKIIWVHPTLSHYFIEASLDLSTIFFDMTFDHMKIYGELGNTRLVDLTNYPYTIQSQNDYLELKNKNHNFTEILGFKDSSSLQFEYTSYSLICPLMHKNYTSKAYVEFNSVRLNFVQEQFFRVFNYLFDNFLGALAAPQNIKDYKSTINKLPKLKEDDIEFMDLLVKFYNPQVLLKPRYRHKESFLADLGTVTITNSYKKIKNKSKIFPDKEKYISTYSFDLKDFFIVTEDNFKLIEKTNASIDMDFINLTNEEKLINDPDYLDKCFDFYIKLDDIFLNLRQKDFTTLMKCSDLNLVYVDGLAKFYDSDNAKQNTQNENENNINNNNAKNPQQETANIKTNENIESESFIHSNDRDFVYKCNKYNYMLVNLEIPNISLGLCENKNSKISQEHKREAADENLLEAKIFSSLVLKKFNLCFAQKLTGRKDITLTAKMFEIYHHLINNAKEMMLSQYTQSNSSSNSKNLTKKDNMNLINLDTNADGISEENLLEITFVIEFDRDKNIIIKINNLKTILRLDTLQLMRYFFTEGFPYYDENDLDLPNQFDPDTDKTPGMRVLIEIRKPLISLLSETISNYSQDIITLSTDMVLVYHRKKVLGVKKELKKAYKMLKADIAAKEKSSKEKKLIEDEIYDDKIDSISINLWLYDVCPFVCSLEEFHEKDIYIPKRKIMNSFDFNYESKTIMQYLDPDNYIVTYDSNIDVKNIVLKVSYRDLVLFLKVMEYNNSLLNEEYEAKINSLKNISYEIAMNQKRMSGSVQNPSNDSRYSLILRNSMSQDIILNNLKASLSNPKSLSDSKDKDEDNSASNIEEGKQQQIEIEKEKTQEKNKNLKSVNEDKIIDNGMSLMKINLEEIQIILIDDHANTLYPFLSVVIQKFNLANDCRTLRHSAIFVTFLFKLITYNYFAAIWEPLIEKSSVSFDYEKTIENNIIYTKTNLNIFEYKQSIMNINISDLTFCFLYSTFNSWVEKYLKLKNNYQVEVKKIIDDRNQIISNHKIMNYTGRKLIVYRVEKNNSERIELKRLEPNEEYDLEYLIDENENEEMVVERVKNTQQKNSGFNLIKENLISIEFEDMIKNSIIDDIIKIDKIQMKYHPVNFETLIKKYKTSREITKEYEQIISQVEYVNMKKIVKIYSPICFKNKSQKALNLIFQRRDLPNLQIQLNHKESCGVPFEYMDGKVQFCLVDNIDFSKTNEMIFDLLKFFDKDFSKVEFSINGIYITLSKNNLENTLLHTINISTAFTIRNCLPFDLNMDILMNKSYKNFLIPKSESVHLDFFSAGDNILANVTLLNLRNKSIPNTNNPSQVQLYNAHEFTEQIIKTYGKKSSYNSFTMRSEFTLYDDNNNPVKLIVQIDDNFHSKTLIIYANAVIINQTMLNLKFFNLVGKKQVDIPGQINTNLSCEDKNIFLISDEKLLIVEVLDAEKKKINCISEPIRLNAIGLASMLQCKGKDITYEFINETHLSLVAKDLEIYTNIIRILPKYIIVNELNIPIMVCLNEENFSNKDFPETINSKEKRPFHFFGKGTDSQTCFRPIEEGTDKKYQSGSKWMWSYSMSLENSNYMTLQIPGINPLENKYINFEKKIIENITYIILSEPNFKNCQFLLENNCKNKSFKISQKSYEYSSEFLNADTKKIFSWANYNETRLLNVEIFDTGNIDKIKSIMFNYKMDEVSSIKELNYEKLFLEKFSYEIKEEGVIIKEKRSNSMNSSNKKSFNEVNSNLINLDVDQYSKINEYPFEHKIQVSKDVQIIVSISTDGYRKFVKFSENLTNHGSTMLRKSEKLNVQNANEKSHAENETEKEAQLKNKTIELNQFCFKISRLGISVISDNRYIKESRRRYNRFEILYIIFKDIEFLNSTQTENDLENPQIINAMQLKIFNAEFDNQYSPFTKYPIVFKRNLEQISVDKDNNAIVLPFFNLIIESKKNRDEILINKNLANEYTDLSKSLSSLKYLIQSFELSVDSEVMEAILNFISNITFELNTSLTFINPIFESWKQNKEKNITIKNDFYDFQHYYNNLKISNLGQKYFIQMLETSSMEMKLSFSTNSKSKFFQKYVTSNPFLSSILSTVSNIDKADINLNAFQMQNIYGSTNDIFNSIISEYNQAMLSKVFRIFGAADFLGNPNNLVKNLGTGFKDFFRKPIEGALRGPLDGFIGAIDGSVSLVKHAVDGTFSATSKIAGGLSKGILYISQDEKYMNDIEKKKITEKPTNFIEGFGYGISSMASGVCSGVKDVFVKPVEGARKENIAGFGKGILKGFGGLLSKPISGFLELVSKTSEGIKNTVVEDKSDLRPERMSRPFYGKHKYIKTFNHFDAYVVDLVKNKVDQLRNIHIDYNGAELYKNHKNDSILLIFSTQMIYLIDIARKEIKAVLNFQDIKDVNLLSKDGKTNFYDRMKFTFKRLLNNRDSATIYFSPDNSNSEIIYKKTKKIIEDFNDK